jgi:DNA mismatch endonuclease (patch repair protein)
MPDTYSPAVRSRVMSRVKGRDTGPELSLRKALFAAGLRGWRCSRKSLPGKPDISFGRRKVAVFVDGAFWHGHPSKYWPGRSGPYWDAKIKRNQERDRRVAEELRDLGWTVLRFWDFEIKADLDGVVQKVESALHADST